MQKSIEMSDGHIILQPLYYLLSQQADLQIMVPSALLAIRFAKSLECFVFGLHPDLQKVVLLFLSQWR